MNILNRHFPKTFVNPDARLNPCGYQRIHYSPKTIRIIAILVLLVTLLTGCSSGSNEDAPKNPTATAPDSGELSNQSGLPFNLHDFDLFAKFASIIPAITLLPEPFMSEIIFPSILSAATEDEDPFVPLPCSSGNATLTPDEQNNDDVLDAFHYSADKCYYSEGGIDNSGIYFDGTYNVLTYNGQISNDRFIAELDRFFVGMEVNGPSDPRIPPHDYLPSVSGRVLYINDDKTGATITSDELIIANHGSVRNYSSTRQTKIEQNSGHSLDYDITLEVKDPYVVEGKPYPYQAMSHLMGYSEGTSDKDYKLKNDTYELQFRTLEPFNGDDSSVSVISINLVSHNISATVRYFNDEGGYEVTYTNNGETQTKIVRPEDLVPTADG
jgi:hypothetical protein